MSPNLKAVLDFIAENPWQVFFLALVFRPFKLVSITDWGKEK
jgi:hypothetical protein